MAFEDPRRREFSQFVADHVFGDIKPRELAAVMHQEGLTNEFRHNRAVA